MHPHEWRSDMAVKLFSESMDATITDDDQIRIDEILSFWFMEQTLSAPQIDGRLMNVLHNRMLLNILGLNLLIVLENLLRVPIERNLLDPH